MNDIEIKLNSKKGVGLLSKKEGLSDLVPVVLNPVLEHQLKEHLGAARYEHKAPREGCRYGCRASQLYTRIGALTLRVPKPRVNLTRFHGDYPPNCTLRSVKPGGVKRKRLISRKKRLMMINQTLVVAPQ